VFGGGVDWCNLLGPHPGWQVDANASEHDPIEMERISA